MVEKLKYVIKEICLKNNDKPCVEIIENSVYTYKKLRKQYTYETEKFEVTFSVIPNIYIKHVDDINRIRGIIEHYINQSIDTNSLNLKKVEIKLDYNKLLILNSEISVVQTPWEEINTLQEKLIDNIKISNVSVDFQNIGNSSRTIMNKLSLVVFNSEVHVAPKTVDVSSGKFKNQLHTYIDSILKGSENKELRQFSESAIEFCRSRVFIARLICAGMRPCVIITIPAATLNYAAIKIYSIRE